SADGTGERQEDTLGKEFAYHSNARRSEREPDGDLLFPSPRAREHQIRKVGTGNQQDESRNSPQQPKRRFRILPQLGESRARGEHSQFVFKILFYGLGVVKRRNCFLENRRCNGVDLRIRARNRPRSEERRVGKGWKYRGC